MIYGTIGLQVFVLQQQHHDSPNSPWFLHHPPSPLQPFHHHLHPRTLHPHLHPRTLCLHLHPWTLSPSLPSTTSCPTSSLPTSFLSLPLTTLSPFLPSTSSPPSSIASSSLSVSPVRLASSSWAQCKASFEMLPVSSTTEAPAFHLQNVINRMQNDMRICYSQCVPEELSPDLEDDFGRSITPFV